MPAAQATRTNETTARPGPRRVCVVGTTGSGKTTLAGELARRLGVPHVELDALRHGPNWVQTPDEVMRAQALARLDAADESHDGWITDGNYSHVRQALWSRADTVIWLDYGLSVILSRLFKRTLRRTLTQEELWNGNRERFLSAFASRESLFLWVLQTYKRRRRDYPPLFALPENAPPAVVRLR